jgi:hypothetical protein
VEQVGGELAEEVQERGLGGEHVAVGGVERSWTLLTARPAVACIDHVFDDIRAWCQGVALLRFCGLRPLVFAYGLVAACALGVFIDSALLARRWRRERTVGRLQAIVAPPLWAISVGGCLVFALPFYLWQRQRTLAVERRGHTTP